MKRFSSRGAALAGGLGLAVTGGAFAVMQTTGADRLVDGRYDQAIAVASFADRSAAEINVDLIPQDLLRLATTGPAAHAAIHAATEHAWLTRPALQGAPTHGGTLQGSSAPASDGRFITSTVGARFTVTNGGVAQTLEVVDVRALTAAAKNSFNDDQAKFLLVSCRVVGPEKPAGANAGLVRFIVDAAESSTNQVLPLRVL
jgi:hypothetical protein